MEGEKLHKEKRGPGHTSVGEIFIQRATLS